MCPPRGMATSPGHAHWSFKKFWKVNMPTHGMLVEVPCHVDEFGSAAGSSQLKRKTNKQRKMEKENQAITFYERGITTSWFSRWLNAASHVNTWKNTLISNSMVSPPNHVLSGDLCVKIHLKIVEHEFEFIVMSWITSWLIPVSQFY